MRSGLKKKQKNFDCLPQKVEEFQHLIRIVTTDVMCITEIKRIIGIAKTGFRRIYNILTNARLSIEKRTPAIRHMFGSHCCMAARLGPSANKWRKYCKRWRCGPGGKCWELVGRWGEATWIFMRLLDVERIFFFNSTETRDDFFGSHIGSRRSAESG